MACGLPILASDRTAAPDIVSPETGSVIRATDLDAWISALRHAAANRERLPGMRRAARNSALKHSWTSYRRAVSDAVEELRL
jgi:glycosyltransferase involved in cell wall biosynthesis